MVDGNTPIDKINKNHKIVGWMFSMNTLSTIITYVAKASIREIEGANIKKDLFDKIGKNKVFVSSFKASDNG